MEKTTSLENIIDKMGMEEQFQRSTWNIESVLADSEFMTNDHAFTKNLQELRKFKKFMIKSC